VLIFSLCFALLAGSVLSAGAYDLTKVKNKSFEKDTNGDGIPNAWNRGGTIPGKRVCNQAYAGSCSYRMVGDGSSGYLYQETLYSSGPAGVTATLSAWTKGKSVVIGGGYANVLLFFDHSDASSNSCFFNIPAGTSPWTMGDVTCAATESFDNIQIWLQANLDSGKIWVDKVKIVTQAP
jgi:hypothetical protein